MGTIDGLGGMFNFLGNASGAHIDMKHAEAVTFVSFLGVGTQTVTLRESIGGASEQLLAKIEELWIGPAIGGTWTKVTQTAGSAFTNADAVNDTIVFTVLATELSDGFDSLEVTASSGSLLAILHGLHHQRAPVNLKSSV